MSIQKAYQLVVKQHARSLQDLNDIQFRVTQEGATERPFSNEYWDFDGEGIYVDIVSGEALFSSAHKFDSDCG